MRTSSFLVDKDQTILFCGRFSLPSDIYRSTMYAYHHEYLNIVNARKLTMLHFGHFRFLFKPRFQTRTKGDIRSLYVHYVYLLIY